MQYRQSVVVFLILALLLTSCDLGTSPESSGPGIDAQLAQEIETVVSATGEVRPARWANTSFPIAGRVQDLLVKEGEDVQAGQALVQLDTLQLARAVPEAQAVLAAAEAELARIRAGSHPQDIEAARHWRVVSQRHAREGSDPSRLPVRHLGAYRGGPAGREAIRGEKLR